MLNAFNLLSIEGKDQRFDSTAFVIKDESELCNEVDFLKVKEPINTGTQALSFGVGVISKQDKETRLYGLAERCYGSISLPDTTDGSPYRLFTADHYSPDMPRQSMYGVVPLL